MTLTLNLPEHLAAPLDVQPVTPGPWTGPALSVDMPDDREGGAPSFLVSARRTTDEYPDNALAWARRAQAEQAAGDIQEAVTAAERAFHLALAQQLTSALQAALVILVADDHTEPLRILLDDDRAGWVPTDLRVRAAAELDEFDAALSMAKDTSVETLQLLAWVHLKRHAFHKAISALRMAQRQGAAGPALLTNLGYAHAALGNIDKAIRITRQAAALSPRDRLIGFNLAGYHRAIGDFDGALDAVKQLQLGSQPDFELALAMAEILTAASRSEQALRVLQRVRTSQQWTTASALRRCELEANLALLRWMTNREADQAAIKAVLGALKDCDYQSVAVAYMLLNLVRRPDQGQMLQHVIEELTIRHPQSELHGLRMHLAVLQHAPELAVEHAVAWSDAEPLNPLAAALAVHLLSDLAGRFEEAADLGERAVARNPASALLANNTAYAMALAGRPEQAQRVLASLGSEIGRSPVVHAATQALIDLMRGERAKGLHGYREARELAEKCGDEPLAWLVKLNMALAINQLPDDDKDTYLAELLPLDIPSEWAQRSDFWITGQRLRKELGIELPSGAAPAAG